MEPTTPPAASSDAADVFANSNTPQQHADSFASGGFGGADGFGNAASFASSSFGSADGFGGGFSSFGGSTEGLIPPVQALSTGFVFAPAAAGIHAAATVAGAAAVAGAATGAITDASTAGAVSADAAQAAMQAIAAGQAALDAQNPNAAAANAAANAAAAAANPAADPNAAMAQMLADALPQTPAELQALAGAQLDAEFIVGASQRQGFLLGDVGVMVSYEDGSELTDMPQLYYLPNAPTWFLGMANLHGNMIPVFDLAAYLGVEPTQTETDKKQDIDNKRMLLVLAHGADATGVVVHGIPQRLYVMQEQRMAPDVAPNLLLPHVTDAYLMDNRVWFDLEVPSLLTALEGAMQTM